jgi:alanine racemase
MQTARLDSLAVRPQVQARIDTDAVRDNVAAVRARVAAAHPAGSAPGLLAVVKANAYGHGLVPCARAALLGGADLLGTAVFAESLALRAAGIEARLLSWLAAPAADYAPVLTARIEIGVSSTWQLTEVLDAAERTGTPATVHLKVDTGLGRNGAMPADWPELVAATAGAVAAGSVRLAGVFTHLASAEDPTDRATDAQLAAFADARAVVDAAGLHPEFVHAANSAAALTRSDSHLDLVRVGLACYGLSPIPDQASASQLGLRPAMRLSAHLAAVKDVPAGQGVSYNLTYRTRTATRLGLVPLGYADGIPRTASGVGPVLVGGTVRPIAGRVAMDQVVLDLGPDFTAEPGDEVVLFGPGDSGEPTVQDWASACGTISYEITTRIPAHVPRLFVGAGAAIGVAAAAGGSDA